MIRSMTGFAREDTTAEWGRYSWELRSVNHRYLDLRLRLPEEFRALEPKVRELAAKRVGRGKLDCVLRFETRHGNDAPLELDNERLQRLAEACATVTEQVKGVGDVDPMRLLNWPGVVLERRPALEELEVSLLDLLTKAFDDLDQAREREGRRLAEFLVARIDTLEARVADVRARLPEVRAHWYGRLKERVEQLAVDADPGRLEQEIAIQATKADVDEELDRLSVHLESLRSTLKRSKPVGRKLDFLMQECHREANTIGSKSPGGEITNMALEMKVAVEQIREQVQNIE